MLRDVSRTVVHLCKDKAKRLGRDPQMSTPALGEALDVSVVPQAPPLASSSLPFHPLLYDKQRIYRAPTLVLTFHPFYVPSLSNVRHFADYIIIFLYSFIASLNLVPAGFFYP